MPCIATLCSSFLVLANFLMAIPRRLYPLAAIVVSLTGIFVFSGITDPRVSFNASAKAMSPHASAAYDHQSPSKTSSVDASSMLSIFPPRSTFSPGTPKLPGSNYTRALLIARTSSENVSWIQTELSDPNLETIIYTADDPTAQLHPPKNKGHEVMIYLTYIIAHYHSPTLPDIILFMHSHRWTYHNNELQDADAVRLIRDLSSERVIREGYMNMRCHWSEGCPSHLHPLSTEPDFHHIQGLMAQQWPLIFPRDPIPDTLAQPCCAQFAVSKERILSIPLATYLAYRDWLLRTPLTDYYSGRLWEYLWQYVFTARPVVCPAEHVCYCDGFGICFGGEEEYENWFELQKQKNQVDKELKGWREMEGKINWHKAAGKEDVAKELERRHERGADVALAAKVQALSEEMERRLDQARSSGRDPSNRAREAGREWKEGDGF